MKVQFYNWWNTENNNIQDTFFLDFFNYAKQNWIIDNQKIINIFSVFGSIETIETITKSTQLNNTFNIFFNGENTNILFTEYCDEYTISNYVDCILTFNNSNKLHKKIRFPLWIIYWNFYRTGLAIPNSNNLQNKLDKAIIIVNHDQNRIRNITAAKLQYYGISVDSNNDCIICSKKIKVGKTVQDKLEIIDKYKYNICCENSVADNYITEKCFQSLVSGCIALYYGPELVENKVLYQDNIINIKNINPKTLSKNFDYNKIWKKNALLYIYTAYLKLWSSIITKFNAVKKEKKLLNNYIIYNCESLTESKEKLYSHWLQYNNFNNPMPIFVVNETEYWMEDLANDLDEYIL